MGSPLLDQAILRFEHSGAACGSEETFTDWRSSLSLGECCCV